jgi:type IV secretory pathway VirD2 relaxase
MHGGPQAECRAESPSAGSEARLLYARGHAANKVLVAVRSFAWEEFALKHRYAMVLHTDEPHPHVHLMVKAMGEDGNRLNIRRATLRDWRRELARHLRAQGTPEPGKARLLETRRNEPLPRTEKESIARSLEEKSRIPADRDMTR